MDNQISIISQSFNGNTKQTTTGREIAVELEITSDVSSWILKKIDSLKFIEGEDYTFTALKAENPLGGRPEMGQEFCNDSKFSNKQKVEFYDMLKELYLK